MQVTVLLTSLSLTMPVSACPEPTTVAFDVIALHGTVYEATDYTLAQINEMAHRTDRSGKHAPLGFYSSDFGYTISVNVSAIAETACSEPVHLAVTLMVSDRRIQIGKDLLAEPCLYALAREHCRRHAAADDVALSESTPAVEKSLQQVSLPRLQHDATRAGADREKLQVAVRVAVDQTLAQLEAQRANAREAVDTPEEVKKLSGTCRPGG